MMLFHLFLQLIAILLPFIVVHVYYFIRRDVYDLHHAILGISFRFVVLISPSPAILIVLTYGNYA